MDFFIFVNLARNILRKTTLYVVCLKLHLVVAFCNFERFKEVHCHIQRSSKIFQGEGIVSHRLIFNTLLWQSASGVLTNFFVPFISEIGLFAFVQF